MREFLEKTLKQIKSALRKCSDSKAVKVSVLCAFDRFKTLLADCTDQSSFMSFKNEAYYTLFKRHMIAFMSKREVLRI